MVTPTNIPKVSGTVNIVVEQGATYSALYTWTDLADSPQDLTGYTARAQIRLTHESAAFIHEMTTENGGITLGGAAGTIQLTISATDTAAFTFSKAKWDLELVTGATVTRLLEGSVTLRKEVTK